MFACVGRPAVYPRLWVGSARHEQDNVVSKEEEEATLSIRPIPPGGFPIPPGVFLASDTSKKTDSAGRGLADGLPTYARKWRG